MPSSRDSLLAKGLRDANAWPAQIYLSMNLSPRQFADLLLAQRIRGILTEAGFPPQRLEIEITETAVVQRLEEAKATLKSLRNLGVRLLSTISARAIRACIICGSSRLDTIKID